MTYGTRAPKEIRMSARTLQELLAGRLPHKLFNERFNRPNEVNIFERQLRMGCLLESTTIEKHPDEDSDEIVFRFGEPDPTAADFFISPNGNNQR